ncbi:cationic amino acid transporter 8, vacuolar-like [Panicum miliaceum]|uniref:Cationic amino acid transporter 8, vacuolar-like n=1 Tax=Panicum miliaceum TaxID=4540 RepID=A0A3L6S4S3_PANMI|nr:cationic amino acid transporter 8, vacuolar-like [Panicum miliaceum]
MGWDPAGTLQSAAPPYPKTSSESPDRVTSRSSEAVEAGTLLAQSENPLRRCLSWVDLAFLGFGSVVGSGVFVLTGQEARFDAGPAVPLAYAAAGFSALLSSFCYAELATEIPSAGGSFYYLRVELGDLAAFLAAGNILLEAVVGAAGLGRSWTSYLAALIGRDSDALRIHVPALAEGFNLLDLIAVVVLCATSALAVSGARLTSTINSAASVVGIAIIAFVLGGGFAHFDPANLGPSFFPFGAAGVFRAAAVVYWSYTGFDMVATMAEETRNPGRDMPLGLISSMSAITVVYCAMSLALVGMQRYSEIDANAAYSVAFAAAGMKWARYVVALGALKGMTSGLLVGALGQARYTTQIARTHMIPPYFALVHPRTGTPIYATVAVALLVRRYYVAGATSPAQLRTFLAFLALIVFSSIGMSVYYNSGYARRWPGYVAFGALWVAGTAGLALCAKQQRAPKVYGVPLMPWLPAMSVATNLFLMGSLGSLTYMRFGICTAAMLVYYVLFGVHATYDMAHSEDQTASAANAAIDGVEQGKIVPV